MVVPSEVSPSVLLTENPRDICKSIILCVCECESLGVGLR